MPEPLTKLERRILDYLVDYLRRNTYQPSIREIGRRFDIKSTKTVSEYLQALADKGWIERDPSRSRGVRLMGLNLNPEVATVPCYGSIAPEGHALDADAVIEEFDLDRKLVSASGTFFLPMRGDSLDGLGIRDGDLLLVEPAPPDELENGDIIAARLNGAPTVKRYMRRSREVVLESANRNFPAVIVGAGAQLEVLGRIIGVFRRIRTPVPASAATVS